MWVRMELRDGSLYDQQESWVAVESDMGEDWFLCVNLYDFRLLRFSA